MGRFLICAAPGGMGRDTSSTRGRARRARPRLSRQRRARDGRGYPGPDRRAAIAAHCRGGPGCPRGGTEHTASLPELLQCDNVVVTPHVAGRAPESRTAATAMILANLNAHFAGQPLPSSVVVRPERPHRGDARVRGATLPQKDRVWSSPIAAWPRAAFPGPICWPLPGDMLGFVCWLKHDYGDVVAFRLGPERTVLLSHPAHLHEVLVRQHRAFQKGRRGDVQAVAWGRVAQRRRCAASAPAPSPATGLASSTPGGVCHRDDDACRAAQPGWQDGDTLDITPAMMRVTLAIAPCWMPM